MSDLPPLADLPPICRTMGSLSASFRSRLPSRPGRAGRPRRRESPQAAVKPRWGPVAALAGRRKRLWSRPRNAASPSYARCRERKRERPARVTTGGGTATSSRAMPACRRTSLIRTSIAGSGSWSKSTSTVSSLPVSSTLLMDLARDFLRAAADRAFGGQRTRRDRSDHPRVLPGPLEGRAAVRLAPGLRGRRTSRRASAPRATRHKPDRQGWTPRHVSPTARPVMMEASCTHGLTVVFRSPSPRP